MADDKIVEFPQDERILEILDSTGMGVKGMWLVRAAFPNVTVEQVLAILERHAVN